MKDSKRDGKSGDQYLGPRKNGFKSNKKDRHQCLGGRKGGLSLAAFANAKSNTDFNPALLRKQREYYKNAKNVKKYMKLLKHLGEGNHNNELEMDTTALELNQQTEGEQKQKTVEQHTPLFDANDNGQALPDVNEHVDYQKNKAKKGYYEKQKGKDSYHQQQKGKNTLEKLREEYEKQKQEEERLRKEREEAIAAKCEAREKAESKRRDLKAKMSKKTRSGQPVMKFRMEHLLDKIQNSN